MFPSSQVREDERDGTRCGDEPQYDRERSPEDVRLPAGEPHHGTRRDQVVRRDRIAECGTETLSTERRDDRIADPLGGRDL